MYHDFNYEATLASSLRAAWQLDDVLRGETGYSILRRHAGGEAQPALSLPVEQPKDGASVCLQLQTPAGGTVTYGPFRAPLATPLNLDTRNRC